MVKKYVPGLYINPQYPERFPGHYTTKASPAMFNIELFDWLYQEELSVKREKVHVAVLYCDSVSWDNKPSTRDNNGNGTASKPFHCLCNAISQAQFIRDNFGGLRVKIIVSGVLDYEIGNGDLTDIVIDFTECNVLKTPRDLANPYLVGMRVLGGFTALSEDDERNYNKTILDRCKFSDKEDNDYGLILSFDYSAIINNCEITTGALYCDYPDDEEDFEVLLIDSEITLTGYQNPFSPTLKITALEVDKAVDCKITIAEDVNRAYLRHGELINCQVNREWDE